MPRDLAPSRAAPRAVVIGGGFGGMAAALRLRARGYAVTLLERGDRLGGRGRAEWREGFAFDAGPSVLTAPHLLDELFALFGRRLADAVELIQPDPWYRFIFADGETFDYGASDAALEAEIERFAPADAAGLKGFRAHARAMHDIAFAQLAHQPFHDPVQLARQAPALARLRAWESVWAMTGRHFRDARLRQAFSVAPLLVGGDPHATTSIYAMIHHLERADGVWFPRGGFGAVVSALGRLMEEAGVDIRLGETVERVLVEHGRAVGVLLHGGRRVSADLVVSNADPMQLYGEMLPKAAQSRLARARTRHARPSMGVVLLHFGAERRWPGVAQHTIRFGGRYREALRDVFRRGRMPEDPPIYLHRPTATDPSLAPEGCDAFYALVPAPTLRAGVDWREEGPRMRDRIVATLDATILPGLAGAIRAERLTTPADFAERYLSVDGAGFSLAPDFTQSAWFRFHNRGEGVSSLYLVGAGAHPGAGVPGVLSSAKAVDSLVPAPESAS